MRKIFLTAIALLSMASASVFGMYGVDSDWIFFLTHGNQFQVRLETLGFTLGNDMIKGTFGFDNPYSFGDMLQVPANGDGKFIPNMSMGIGYTSSAIGIGVGYTMSFGDKVPIYKGKVTPKNQLQLGHTPVLVLNALDNALRIAVPIQVYQKSDKTPVSEYKYTAVSMDAQIRYYTGLDMLPQIRLYLRFGHYDTEDKVGNITTKTKAESFGFDFRLFFGAMVEEVALQPIVKIQFNTALGKNHNTTRIQAINILKGSQTVNGVLKNDKNPYTLNIIPALGISANSDIVSLYLEPSLGLKITGSASKNVKEAYDLGYGVYGEIYITPVKNVEWYFEAELGNIAGSVGEALNLGKGLGFNASTGITWYLPAL
ncbi:cell surface protein [Brachyspira aalborgi]|uniref:cell surface protein n=1 Tax=Brachyspira aalborgi TaxID=29522 RepID=UPI0011C7F44B|nr:cell surface protein [Brachyspira aalborgi]TXJ41656.1 cell surface protein [Brachyspira aalborgi]